MTPKEKAVAHMKTARNAMILAEKSMVEYAESVVDNDEHKDDVTEHTIELVYAISILKNWISVIEGADEYIH